jgi:hypothetical protein
MMQLRYFLVVLLVSFTLWGMGQTPSASLLYDIPASVEAGKPFIVRMKFSPINMNGIARIQQSWPRGFSINEVENAGSIFSYSKSQLQFLWISLPAIKEIDLSFEVTASADYTGKVEIPALIAYLEDNQRKELNFQALRLEVQGKGKKAFEKPISPTLSNETLLADSKTPPIRKENTSTHKQESPEIKNAGVKKKVGTEKQINPVAVKEIKTPVKTESKSATPPRKNESIKPAVLTPQTTSELSKTRITFRIQVAALPEKSDKAAIAKDFGVETNELQEENHNGLYKYTFGEFTTLADARKIMNSNARMKGIAFISGYRNGIRIDLEEAIRLSKEK